MQVGERIKENRSRLGLSQEELADKLYVSRQTVSNWETDKNYPDIHSLILLSSIFDVSLDQLIKGDIEYMEEKINQEEVKKLKHYGAIYSILFAVTVVGTIPLFFLLGQKGHFVWVSLVMVTLFYAFKVEKIKKDNDIQSYKEIVAFSKGEKLDEIQRQVEKGKRPYQKFIAVLAGAAVGFIACAIGVALVLVFFN